MALPSETAVPASGAPETCTRSTWRTPSPLRTTSSARSAQTARSAASKAARSGQATLPDETATTVSEVEVSLSMEMRLNVSFVTRDRMVRSCSRGTTRSVRM